VTKILFPKIILRSPSPSDAAAKSVFAYSKTITEYQSADLPDVDLDNIGEQQIENINIRIIDPVDDYAELMRSLFDFDLLKQVISSGKLTLRFDIVFDTKIFIRATRVMTGRQNQTA
jgi:phosphoglucomutase